MYKTLGSEIFKLHITAAHHKEILKALRASTNTINVQVPNTISDLGILKVL